MSTITETPAAAEAVPGCRSPTARQWLAIIASAVALLAVFESSRLDLAIAKLFFDPSASRFPAQHHWFFEQILHHGLKSLLVGLTVLALGICGLGIRGKLTWLRPAPALAAALGMLLIPLATSLLKLATNRHCPWSIEDFGGFAPYFGLLEMPPSGLVRGVCFPAGHASAGFAWIVWAFALAGTRPGWAKAALYGALALGLLMGVARMAQGAHFLSHVLWSAWLAWAISAALMAAVAAWCARRAPAAASDAADSAVAERASA